MGRLLHGNRGGWDRQRRHHRREPQLRQNSGGDRRSISRSAANNVNNKIDISNAYSAAYKNAAGEDILYFALERSYNGGDANVGRPVGDQRRLPEQVVRHGVGRLHHARRDRLRLEHLRPDPLNREGWTPGRLAGGGDRAIRVAETLVRYALEKERTSIAWSRAIGCVAA